jgi:hypothetical protein
LSSVAPFSETTLTPECGGNSNSFSEMPDVRMIVFEKVRPGYWVVRIVLPGNPSKLRVVAEALALEPSPRRATIKSKVWELRHV